MGKGGTITTDTCNHARLMIFTLEIHVIEVAKEKEIVDGEDGSDVLLHTIDCHNYLRNF